MASAPIYQIYAELDNYEPKIWRRFQVLNTISMARLGYILMTMFEMQAKHLFCFDVPSGENRKREISKRLKDTIYFSDLEREFREPYYNQTAHIELVYEDDLYDLPLNENEIFYDAAKTKMKEVISNPEDTLSFTYDYGDNWNISITVEKIFLDNELPGSELPRVIEGVGYGIVEDCSGTYGLEQIAKAFKARKGKQYDHYSSWLGVDDLDLESFDINDINFRLKRVPRIYSDLYEHDYEPTKRSMDILTRKYMK